MCKFNIHLSHPTQSTVNMHSSQPAILIQSFRRCRNLGFGRVVSWSRFREISEAWSARWRRPFRNVAGEWLTAGVGQSDVVVSAAALMRAINDTRIIESSRWVVVDWRRNNETSTGDTPTQRLLTRPTVNSASAPANAAVLISKCDNRLAIQRLYRRLTSPCISATYISWK